MATKAEQARTEEQQARAREHVARLLAKHRRLAARRKRPSDHASEHASRKATHAYEAHLPGTRPSRVSTRKGANHLRSDAGFATRGEGVESAPHFRADQARIHALKVRGHR